MVKVSKLKKAKEKVEERLEQSVPGVAQGVPEVQAPEPVEPRLEVAPEPEVKKVEEVDYLRKYQYKKQTKFGSPESDPAPGSKAEIMKKQLLAQPKYSIFIPLEQGQDSSVKLSVTLNGYRLDLPKQVYLELPSQISEVIMESLRQQTEALKPYRIDGNKDKENALS